MKAIRFSLINLPGRVVKRSRRLIIRIGLVEALWFYKARIKKISNWLANLDFSKIRMGWVKQVIVSIFQTKVIIYLTITFEIFMKSVFVTRFAVCF